MDREKVKGKKAHHFRCQDFLLNTVSYQFSSGSLKIANLLTRLSFCEMAMFTSKLLKVTKSHSGYYPDCVSFVFWKNLHCHNLLSRFTDL